MAGSSVPFFKDKKKNQGGNWSRLEKFVLDQSFCSFFRSEEVNQSQTWKHQIRTRSTVLPVSHTSVSPSSQFDQWETQQQWTREEHSHEREYQTCHVSPWNKFSSIVFAFWVFCVHLNFTLRNWGLENLRSQKKRPHALKFSESKSSTHSSAGSSLVHLHTSICVVLYTYCKNAATCILL